MENQVIEINGIFYYIEDGMNALQNILVKTDTLSSHPDQTEMESAKQMLIKLAQSNLLSNRAKAIIKYDIALVDILKFSEPEKDK